ncbi:MAG: hypothetical protein EBU08_11275 [Micrococcales bacterium]|nr:hypothetical protein [Micrococcales bacterium]
MSNVIIPDEYKMFDYGFSAVSEIATPQPEYSPPVPIEESSPVLMEKLEYMQNQIEMILSVLNSKESSSSDMTLTEVQYRENIRSLEQIIVPLLNNLLKTADKPYIHWPNRAPIIEDQLKRVLQITRGSASDGA